MTGAHRTSHAPQHRMPVHKVPLFHEYEGLFTVGTGLSGELYILVEVSVERRRGGRMSHSKITNPAVNRADKYRDNASTTTLISDTLRMP